MYPVSPSSTGSDEPQAPMGWTSEYGEIGWCTRCEEYRARRAEKMICPVCWDELDKMSRALKNRGVQDG